MQRGSWRPLLLVLAWPNNLATMLRVVIVSLLLLPMLDGREWPPVWASTAFLTGYWLLDEVDGWLARRLGKTSSFGESLDLFADRYCDMLASASLLLIRPEHAGAVLTFMLLRLAPDGLVGRFLGLSDNMFETAVQRHAPLWPWLARQRILHRIIQANAALKAVFFTAALFWSAPAWAGLALAVPAGIFAVIVLQVMRAHAGLVLGERQGDRGG